MQNRIKILHIIKSLGRGGAEMLLPETIAFHSEANFEFYCIYFLPWKDQMVESIKSSGAEVFCFPSQNNLQIMLKVRQVARFVKNNNIQIIHAHLPWAGILARIVGRTTGIPVIYTEHNKQERYHFATRALNLATMNMNRAVIAVSSDVEKSIRQNKRVITTAIHTILNGVNILKFKRDSCGEIDIRQKLQIPQNSPVVGTVAVFRSQKRLDLWMELAKRITASLPDTHFIIVGDGPLKEELVLKRRALGLENNIHMPGLQTEVRPYLMALDLFMMTSVFEGLPIALLEAMAIGCPVISTDAGGVKEVIRHQEDGFVCPIDDPDQLVAYAVQLLSSPDLKHAYGLKSRKRIESSFSLDKMVTKLEAVYRQIAPNAF